MPYNNNYFPTSYQPMFYTPQVPQAQPPRANSGLIWVQGEAGAKSYLVAPNTTVMLMDSEDEQFFLKSADASGMPQPLRIFKYQEVKVQPTETPKISPKEELSQYVKRDEYEAFCRRVDAFLTRASNQEVTNNE